MKEIILVSDNPGKIKEYQEKLKNYKVIPYKDILAIEYIPETGSTFKENAFLKADTVYRMLNKPCIADDSGLIVNALPNDLGVKSKRFSKEETDQANNALLLEKLKDEMDRSAYFQTVICLIVPNQAPQFFSGKVHGRILENPRGNSGFGYDPLFEVEDLNLTLAQMSIEQKNKISHRARAMDKLLEVINQ
jgi:XTP/dITP diphosphohydrolase